MKKLFVFTFPAVFAATASAQPIPEKNKEGYTNGQVTLADNSVITGTVKDNIRKKGEVIVLKEGKKLKLRAAEVNSVQAGPVHYIAHDNTFFEVVWEGKKLGLYRKANTTTGIQYNGTDPVAVNKSEGELDDHFVRKTGDASFYLLTKKNSKEILGRICNCTIIPDLTDFDTDTIKKALAACDTCK